MTDDFTFILSLVNQRTKWRFCNRIVYQLSDQFNVSFNKVHPFQKNAITLTKRVFIVVTNLKFVLDITKRFSWQKKEIQNFCNRSTLSTLYVLSIFGSWLSRTVYFTLIRNIFVVLRPENDSLPCKQTLVFRIFWPQDNKVVYCLAVKFFVSTCGMFSSPSARNTTYPHASTKNVPARQ